MSRAQAIAAAEKGSEVEVTVIATSYDAILALPQDELMSTLAQGDYSDIQGMCKHLGLNAKGARAELELRLLEHVKEKTEAEDPAVSDSPEGRGGRVRASRPGVAAAIVRNTAAKEEKGSKPKIQEAMEIDPRLLNAAEAQARGVAGSVATGSTNGEPRMPGAASSASSGPAPWPMVPQMPQFPARAFIGTPAPVARASAQSAPSVSPELAAARQRLAAVRSEFETEQVPAEPKIADVLRAIQGLTEKVALKEDLQVAKLETIKEVRSEIAPIHAHVAQIEANTAKALDETKALHDRLVVVESDSTEILRSQAVEFDRVGKLETRVEKLEKVKKGPDLSFQKLAVKQFPKEAPLEERLASMRKFMEEHFPQIQPKSVSVIHRGPWTERGKNRVSTQVGLIDLGDADLREHVLKQIEAKKLTVKCRGELQVTRAMTDNAKDRNTALTEAAALLRKQPGIAEKDVDLQWASRVVKVKNAEAFKQPSGRALGSFCGNFSHLTLP